MSLANALRDVSLWAVLVAGVAHMVTCMVWYTPALFGKAWVELTGKDLKPATRWVGAGILAHLGIAFVLATIVRLAGATTVGGGIAVAVLVWAGFVVTLEIGELIWEKIPFRLFALRAANHLVALGIAGTIVAVWD